MELRIHTGKPYTALNSPEDKHPGRASSEKEVKASEISEPDQTKLVDRKNKDRTTKKEKETKKGENKEEVGDELVKTPDQKGRKEEQSKKRKEGEEESRKRSDENGAKKESLENREGEKKIIEKIPPKGEKVQTLTKERKKSDSEKAKTFVKDNFQKLKMTKMAFGESYTLSQRLNYCPHVMLLLLILMGTVSILGAAGSGQWMRADVNGMTVYYGLFERCVISTTSDVTRCDAFDWAGWLYNTSQDKIEAVRVIAIFSILFASLFLLGAFLLLITNACGHCHGYRRKAFFIVVDVCLWLMVTSAGVSSLLFLTGVDSVEAYPDSAVLWPPVIYCVGWCMALICRLVVAACCDVHRDDVTLPFV